MIRHTGRLPVKIIQRPGQKTIRKIIRHRVPVVPKELVRKTIKKKTIVRPPPTPRPTRMRRPTKISRPPTPHKPGKALNCFNRASAKQSSFWRDRRVKAFNPFKTNRYAARWGSGAFTCTHTLNDFKGAWWSVNFYGTPLVTRVQILNRADCCGGRLNKAKVYVGDKLCGTIKNAR